MDLSKNQRRGLLYAGGAISLIAAFVIGMMLGDTTPSSTTVPEAGDSTTSTPETSTTLPDIDLEVVVDTNINPAVPEIPGFGGEGPPRPVGRTITPEGLASDFVIGEAIIEVPDQAALDELAERTDIEIVDFDVDEEFPEDGFDVLVRATNIEALDHTVAAWGFEAVDPTLAGTLLASSEETAATGVILGRLWNETGHTLGLNYVPIGHDVEEGKLLEAFQDDLNAFNWTFVNSLATQAIGLDTAWQMLDFHGKHQNRVTVLVIDNGFVQNPDFPANARIRKGGWGADDDWTCTNDNPCPYHGTQVALTVAGQHDNLWGTAGVAGPWIQLIVMPTQGGTYSTMKEAREVIKEENVDIVNMSFGTIANTSPDATRRQYDKTFRRARRWNETVAFASAGNDGINVDTTSNPYLPCASGRVVCVGGMGVDETERHDGSNFGTQADSNSVEIYGPMCTYVYEDPSDVSNGDIGRGCGTSYASPFVAGVAALLRVADPSISASGIVDTLYQTAHLGGLGPGVGGNQRRIDAHMAVASALGVTWTPPTISISTEGGTFPVDEVISLSASASSYVGEPVAIRWHSNIDGFLNDFPSLASIGANLSPGDHLIQATAVDRRGLSSTDAINIKIDNKPPIVTIINPEDGLAIYEGAALSMVAYTHDPDIFVNAALPDEAVEWSITEAGSEVWSGTGHSLITALDPGTYEITLTGTDLHGTSRSDSVTIDVLPLPPGAVPPSASIIKPNADMSVGIGANTINIELTGLAKGTDGSTISGRRFRWTATADTGYSFEICTGSNFPGTGGGGGFAIVNDCKNTEVDLGLAPGAVGRTVWSVKMTAVDNSGVAVEAIRRIEVTFATG